MHLRRYISLGLVGLATIAISLLTGGHLPLYDGLATPDEPYRYVASSDDSLKTPENPGTAKTTYTPTTQASGNYISAQSNEQGPQVAFYTYAQAFKLDDAAAKVTLAATPKNPTSERSSIGTLAGNIYRFSASSDIGLVTFIGSSSNQSYINLRLSQAFDPTMTNVTMLYKQTNTWKRLPTSQVGNDIYQAPIVGLGDYVLVAQKDITKPTGKSPWVIVLAITCLAVAFIAIIFVIRQQNITNT